jgi:3-hydroxybutyrate dehydrogenase
LTSSSTTRASSSWPLVDEFPDAKWEQIIAINMSSAFYATKAVLPAMKASVGPHRQYRIRARTGRVALQTGVTAKHGVLGLDQNRGAGSGGARHHLQCHLS